MCTCVVCRTMFGEDPKASPDLARIVSERHAERLKALLDDKPGKVRPHTPFDTPHRFSFRCTAQTPFPYTARRQYMPFSTARVDRLLIPARIATSAREGDGDIG